MPVVEFLARFSDKMEGLAKLEELYGIKARVYDNFFLLNYSQIDSPKMDPIVAECRGIILDWDLHVLRRPFDRFFNYGEAGTDKSFDFNGSICYEKVDGSIVPVWYNGFDGEWAAGTRGTAFAETECASGRVFSDLITDTLGFTPHYLLASAEKMLQVSLNMYTFIFELCTPENRVVTRYPESFMALLAIRNNVSGRYKSQDSIAFFHNLFRHIQITASIPASIRLPKTYDIYDIDSARFSLKDLDALDEGYVFYNPKTQDRVKVKNPSYVAIHHIRDNGNMNPRRICDLVFLNETDEYLQYFPEDTKFFSPWINAYNEFHRTALEIYEKNKHIESQKEFALQVKDLPYSGLLFQMRQGKSFSESINRLHSDKKVDILNSFKGNGE
jgi:hypothetical protein